MAVKKTTTERTEGALEVEIHGVPNVALRTHCRRHSTGPYAVFYAVETARCAFRETLGRNRFARRRQRELPRAGAESALVVWIACEAPLALVDLRMGRRDVRPERGTLCAAREGRLLPVGEGWLGATE